MKDFTVTINDFTLWLFITLFSLACLSFLFDFPLGLKTIFTFLTTIGIVKIIHAWRDENNA